MSIIHIHETNHDFLLDRRLSYKARGVLAYLLKHGNKWEIRLEKLIADSEGDGRIAVQSALQELVKWQYAELIAVRDKAGRVKGKEYNVYDVPLDLQPHRRAGNLPVGCPSHDEYHESRVDTSAHRRAGNLPVGADEQETRPTGNLPVGDSDENGVDTEAHRRAGFPTDGKPDRRETCLSTNSLKEKTQEKTQSHTLSSLPPSEGKERVCESDRQTIGHFEAAFTPRIPYTVGFETVRETYPAGRLEGEHEAFQTWQARGLEARTAEIVAKVERLVQTTWRTRERRYIPLLKTWLDKGRYDDDLMPMEAAEETPQPGRSRDYAAEKAARIEQQRQEFLRGQRGRAPGHEPVLGSDGPIVDGVEYRTHK
jgi:hypothetical protein